MQTAVLTMQTKGQIMLPKDWREELGSTVYQAIKEGNIIILKPVEMASDREVLASATKVMKKNKALLQSLASK